MTTASVTMTTVLRLRLRLQLRVMMPLGIMAGMTAASRTAVVVAMGRAVMSLGAVEARHEGDAIGMWRTSFANTARQGRCGTYARKARHDGTKAELAAGDEAIQSFEVCLLSFSFYFRRKNTVTESNRSDANAFQVLTRLL
jgi:hypothetical protein